MHTNVKENSRRVAANDDVCTLAALEQEAEGECGVVVDDKAIGREVEEQGLGEVPCLINLDVLNIHHRAVARGRGCLPIDGLAGDEDRTLAAWKLELDLWIVEDLMDVGLKLPVWESADDFRDEDEGVVELPFIIWESTHHPIDAERLDLGVLLDHSVDVLVDGVVLAADDW